MTSGQPAVSTMTVEVAEVADAVAFGWILQHAHQSPFYHSTTDLERTNLDLDFSFAAIAPPTPPPIPPPIKKATMAMMRTAIRPNVLRLGTGRSWYEI